MTKIYKVKLSGVEEPILYSKLNEEKITSKLLSEFHPKRISLSLLLLKNRLTYKVSSKEMKEKLFKLFENKKKRSLLAELFNIDFSGEDIIEQQESWEYYIEEDLIPELINYILNNNFVENTDLNEEEIKSALVLLDKSIQSKADSFIPRGPVFTNLNYTITNLDNGLNELKGFVGLLYKDLEEVGFIEEVKSLKDMVIDVQLEVDYVGALID